MEESSTTAPVLGTRMRRHRPACGAYFFILWISSRLSKVTRGRYWSSSFRVSIGFIGLAYMILSQIQASRFLFGMFLIYSCTIMNSGMEATSKLAPAL